MLRPGIHPGLARQAPEAIGYMTKSTSPICFPVRIQCATPEMQAITRYAGRGIPATDISIGNLESPPSFK